MSAVASVGRVEAVSVIGLNGPPCLTPYFPIPGKPGRALHVLFTSLQALALIPLLPLDHHECKLHLHTLGLVM